MRSRRSIVVTVVVLAILATVVGGVLFVRRGPVVTGVATAHVGRSTVQEVVEAPGAVAARATATLTSPTSGSVASLAVRDGQRVRAGQVLAVLASPTAQRQLRQARDADAQARSAGTVDMPASGLGPQQVAADKAARSGFDQARAAANAIPDPTARAQALTAVVSAETQYTAARSAADDAVARFDAGIGSLSKALGSLAGAQRIQTRAAVSVAEQAVGALTIRSPIGGVVALGGPASAAGPGASGGDLSGVLSSLPSALQGQAASVLGGAGGGSSAATSGAIEVGTPVSNGTALATVTDSSELALTADVDETDVLLVAPGVHASAELDAVPGASYGATVTAVEPAPVSSARGGVSFRVRLRLDAGTADDGSVAPTPRPGMSAVVDLRVRTAKNVVSVPVSAVIRDGQRDTVWLVQAGRLEQRAVRLGAQGEDAVEITEGVNEGSVVVVRGADRVHQGQRLT